jgi:hypothetical protein
MQHSDRGSETRHVIRDLTVEDIFKNPNSARFQASAAMWLRISLFYDFDCLIVEDGTSILYETSVTYDA